MDESFTSSPTGFSEVQEVAAGQFPVQFPSQAELVDLAKKGSDAAGQVTIALALGGHRRDRRPRRTRRRPRVAIARRS